MSRATPLDIDLWTPLSYKAGLDGTQGEWLPPSWMPVEAERRLTSYRVLSAYRENSARHLLPTSTEAKKDHREYGDAALICDRIVAGLHGDALTVQLDDLALSVPDTPAIPPAPELDDAATDIDRQIFTVLTELWETEAAETLTRWATQRRAIPGLQTTQDWLETWWDDEHAAEKLHELEAESAVPLGDGVVVLAWSADKGRPTMVVREPDSYHPVLSDEDGFPEKVHFAWETVDDDGDRWLRRITYELVPLETEAGVPYSRTLPWGDATHTCLWSDGSWRLQGSDGVVDPLQDLDEGKAEWETNETGDEIHNFDLLIDFIPVVHIPNTPSSTQHFGRSSIARTLQLFDDIASTDSDVQSASALAGVPLITVSGTNVPADLVLESGRIFGLGESGQMDTLDLSHSVTVLAAVVDALLDRLSTNTKVPPAVLGRIDASDVPSGLALRLSYSPFDQLIAVLRLVRHRKYALILKMAMRLGQLGGVLEPGPTPRASILFGSYRPTDITGTVTMVASLITARAISRRMGLRVLSEAGIEAGDLDEEISRIEREDTSGAKELADATGSEELAARRLGEKIPEAVGAPAVDTVTTTELPGPLS